MSNLTSLATRHAGRPLLLTPRAALELADRVRAVDHGSVVREGRFSALIRKLSGRDRGPVAMEDDGDYEAPSFGERAAYAPRYIGEPDDTGFCWTLKDGVALVNIDKPLLDRGEFVCGEVYHGYDTILASLQEAMADERVRAIFIRAASPGGVVAGGLPALAAWMRENGARAGGKPIWVYSDMACSAMFWIATSADWHVAPRVGLIGSAGACIVHESYAGALDKAGVEITPIVFGAKKTDGAWWEKLSDTAREDLQAEIDQCGRDFVADIVAGRPQLSAEEVIATEARVFMGHHDDAARSALALKLIDAIASEEAAFVELRDKVAGSAPVTVPGSTATAGSARDRASASPAQEATMAQNPKAGGKPSANAQALAAAQARVRKAQADIARLSAQSTEDGEEIEDEEDSASAAEGEGEDQPDASADDDAGEESEAEKIAGSAEGEANPKAATAAIRAGLTYDQFKATASAFAGGGKRQLESTLKGSPRLGADGETKGSPTAAVDPRAIYARRAQRAKAARPTA